MMDQMTAVARPALMGSKGLTGLQGALMNRAAPVGGKLPHLPTPHLPERTSMHFGEAEDTPKIHSFMVGLKNGFKQA